tara:strand:- start:1238 stop:1477 length:240 start_codon:yes stop_codon:yes gene_type:complete
MLVREDRDVNEGELLVVAVDKREDRLRNHGKKVTRFIPTNDVAKILCQIAKKKTLTYRDLNTLDASMNFVVRVTEEGDA